SPLSRLKPGGVGGCKLDGAAPVQVSMHHGGVYRQMATRAVACRSGFSRDYGECRALLPFGLDSRSDGMLTEPHAHRLRSGRCSTIGGIYLLTAVVQDRQPHLASLTATRLLVSELRVADAGGWATSLAWVVMPDHLHWLVQLEAHSLCALMRQVKGRSARRLNDH